MIFLPGISQSDKTKNQAEEQKAALQKDIKVPAATHGDGILKFWGNPLLVGLESTKILKPKISWWFGKSMVR